MVKNRPKKKLHVRKATVDAVAKAWGSAHRFEERFESADYFLDYEVATEHEYIERVIH